MITIYIYLSTNTDDVYFAAFSSCHLAKKMTTVLAGCHRGELFFGLTPGDFPFAWLACEQTRLLFTICPKWRASSHAFPFLVFVNDSLRASSPVWANETIRARTRERAGAPPRRFRVSSRVPLARLLFTIFPKWRACSQAIVYNAIVSPFYSHGSCLQIRSH